jgi:hypothetical protein
MRAKQGSPLRPAASAAADVRLVRLAVTSRDPWAGTIGSCGGAEVADADRGSWFVRSEAGLLEGYRVFPSCTCRALGRSGREFAIGAASRTCGWMRSASRDVPNQAAVRVLVDHRRMRRAGDGRGSRRLRGDPSSASTPRVASPCSTSFAARWPSRDAKSRGAWNPR